MVLDLRKMAAPLANTVETPERSSMGMLMHKPPARGAYVHSRVSLLYGASDESDDPGFVAEVLSIIIGYFD